jgi:DNA-binding response OmpR family regulator
MVPRVAVVADDLIWSTRLSEQLAAAGATTVTARDRAALEAALPDLDAAVVDLTARAYDGVALVGIAAAAGRRVVAVGQHDDREGRRRASDAGAERVFAYRQLAEGGGRLLAEWLATDPALVTPAGSGDEGGSPA